MAQRKGLKLGDIVEAALDVCLEKGWERSSMVTIAKRLHVARSTLEYHFRTKDVLFAAARDRVLEPLRVNMALAEENENAVRGLRFLIKEHLRHFATHPREREFYLMGQVRMQTSRVWRLRAIEHQSRMLHWLHEMLLRGISEGDLVDHDAWSRAVALFSALEGAVPYLALEKKPWSYRRVWGRLERVFLGEIYRGRSQKTKRTEKG